MIRWARRVLWAWLAWRLLGPQLPPPFQGVQERPLRLAGRTVLVGEREYFVREAGPAEAPPLVLVHGWGADSLLNWYRVIPHLSGHFRVIAVDQRNHGKSDRVRGQYRVEGVADELAGVLDALGIGRAVVAGYSMGGMVAQVLAHRHPHRVSKLVLVATAAWMPWRARRPRRLLLRLGRAFERLSPAEGARLRQRYLLKAGAVEPRHARWLWETFMDRDASLFYDAGLAALGFDGREWVGRLDQSALLIITTHDQLVPPSAQHDLAGRLADVSVVELGEAGHEASLTHSEEMAEAMIKFAEEG